jgi:DeoR/GlpR family transcriptional regulator of sugar metabolism
MKKNYEQLALSYLANHEQLTLTDAMKLLNVSSATVRRFFNRLAETHSVTRIHGGIRALPGTVNQAIPFSLREQWGSEEKELLVRRALEKLKPDSVLFVHGGSTMLFLGKYLQSGTVITNSVTLAEILLRRFPNNDGPEVTLCGGTLDKKAGILLGNAAQQAFTKYRADIMITSARGLDSEGILETNEAAVGIQRMMKEHAASVILVADHVKFSTTGSCRSLRWEEIDLLITTDVPETAGILAEVRGKGVKVETLPLPPHI